MTRFLPDSPTLYWGSKLTRGTRSYKARAKAKKKQRDFMLSLLEKAADTTNGWAKKIDESNQAKSLERKAK
jgi:hypothetical protein